MGTAQDLENQRLGQTQSLSPEDGDSPRFRAIKTGTNQASEPLRLGLAKQQSHKD